MSQHHPPIAPFSISRLLPTRFVDTDDQAEGLRMRIFVILILLCIIPMLLMLVLMVSISSFGMINLWTPSALMMLVAFAQSSCLMYFLSSGNINACSIIYSIIIFTLLVLAVYYTGGWYSPASTFLLALPVLACLVLTKTTGMIFSVLVLLAYIGFYLLQQSGHVFPQYISDAFLDWAGIGMWFTTFGFIMGSLVLLDFSTMDLSRVIQNDQKKIKNDLNLDDITGTLNRSACAEKIKNRQQQKQDKKLVLVHIYLASLRSINTSIGYECGDHALKTISKNLRNAAGPQDILSRSSAEYFSLISFLQDPGDIISLVYKIKSAMNQTIDFEGGITITPAFQLSCVATHNTTLTLDQLISEAESLITSDSSAIYKTLD